MNSRGQARQGEYQTDTGDDPLWLYYQQILSEYLLPEDTWCYGEVRGREREETSPLTYAEQEK